MNENKWKRIKWNELLYRFLNAEVLLCMLLFGIGTYCKIEKTGIWHVLAGTAMIVVLTIFNYSGLRGRLLCSIGVIAVCVVIVVFVTPQNMFVFFRFFFDWLMNGTAWIREEQLFYELTQTLSLAILIFFLQVLLEYIPKLKYVIAGASLVFVLISIFMRIKIPHMGVMFLLWYVCLTYIEWTKVYWKKERSRDLKPYMLWIMPFRILYFVILSLFPSFEKPYDWKFVKNMYSSVKESVTSVLENIKSGDDEDFEVGFAGFSESGDLKGSLLENPQEVMTVKGMTSLKTNVYLSGKIFDTFDGNEWSTQAVPYENERLLDTMETLYALRLYEGNSNDFMSETKLEVKYRFFQSAYLFAPVKTKMINSAEKFTQNTDFLFQKKQGYGTKYSISFFQLNLDQPALYEYMESDFPEDPIFWNNMVASYFKNGERKPRWDELTNYRKHIYDNYCKEVALSDKVSAELDQLVEGEQTKIGKLRAIERTLSSYTYTTAPGAIPASVKNESDFLDYFMNKKEGYCSFFATAFIIMARAEGIPARYVEGFSVATHGAKEVPVYAKSAHAWPEVYMDGFGWIPFEPTPGYGEMRYTPWNIGGVPYIDTAGGYYNAGAKGLVTDEEKIKEELEEQENQEQLRTYRLAKIIRITLLSMIALIIIIFLMERLIRKLRYARMSLEERFMLEVKKNLWLLSRLHMERNQAETLEEFKERINLSIPEIKILFIDYLEEHIYGNREIDQKVLQIVVEERIQILMWIREERRLYYYWLNLIM